ncbi:hypothetical protein LUCX_305 [Xanthomonas phage vB_XciM_LucasX]|nr:hypothetical protein LUCX_305 [Xanthomonas phage vB_XciM_LucasX]
MQITPYVPTATQLQQAESFTNFDTDLQMEYDPVASELLGGSYYKIKRSFRYYKSEKQSNIWGYVPAGFLSDGASVPKPLWWLVPPWGNYGQAAVLHDILCETKTMYKDDVPYQISRKEADFIFLDAMDAAGVKWYLRYAMFVAVRLWGLLGWGPSTEKTANKRELETKYMKEYGTYREPTAILRQVTKALSPVRTEVAQQLA